MERWASWKAKDKPSEQSALSQAMAARLEASVPSVVHGRNADAREGGWQCWPCKQTTSENQGYAGRKGRGGKESNQGRPAGRRGREREERLSCWPCSISFPSSKCCKNEMTKYTFS